MAQVKGVTKSLPQLLCADGDNHIFVLSAKDLIGHNVRVGVAHPLRDDIGVKIAAGQHRIPGGLSFNQAHIEDLAAARSSSDVKRPDDADGGIHARGDVGDGDRITVRLTLRISSPGQAHETCFALGDEIVAGTFGVGAGVPVAGDAAINQT